MRSKQEKVVLVVDDNKHMATCLAEMIDILGVKCDVAFEGEQAMKMLEKKSYALVIADSNMPNISGFSILKHVKNNIPGTMVAIISTRDSDSTQSIVTRGKADFYLAKPFKTEDIEDLLSRI
jgi:DNA-binding response OmpR family regulator